MCEGLRRGRPGDAHNEVNRGGQESVNESHLRSLFAAICTFRARVQRPCDPSTPLLGGGENDSSARNDPCLGQQKTPGFGVIGVGQDDIMDYRKQVRHKCGLFP